MRAFARKIAFAFLFCAALCSLPAARAHSQWKGVDETVVEKYAKDAGRPARDPIINTDKGDLLLLMFLLAGVAGGFAMGYSFRKLFHEKKAGGKATDD